MKDGALFNPSQWIRAAIAAGGKPLLIRQDGGGVSLSWNPAPESSDHPLSPESHPDLWAVLDVLYRTGRSFGVTREDMDAERIRLWAPEGGRDAGLIALIRDYHAAGAAASWIPTDTPAGEKDCDLLFRRQEEALFRLATIVPHTPIGVVAKLGVLNVGQDDLTVAEAEALKTIVETCTAAIETMADTQSSFGRYSAYSAVSIATDRQHPADHTILPALNNCEIDAALASVLGTSADVLLASLNRLIETGSFTAAAVASLRAWIQTSQAGATGSVTGRLGRGNCWGWSCDRNHHEKQNGRVHSIIRPRFDAPKPGDVVSPAFQTSVTPQSLQTLSDRQDAIVGLMRRHRRLNPAIFEFLDAGNYLPMTLLLTSDHGGPLVWRFIGSGIVAFGPDWARERIGQPYDVGDPFTNFSSVIDATYAAALGSGKTMTNDVITQLDPLPGAYHGIVRYRQLLLPLHDDEGRQALLIHAEICSSEPPFARVQRRPGRGSGGGNPASGIIRHYGRREPQAGYFDQTRPSLNDLSRPVPSRYPWIGKGAA